jgi:DNA-binding HxlR family transcriptional regulator
MSVFRVTSRKWGKEVLTLLRESEKNYKAMFDTLTHYPGRFKISTRSLSLRLMEMEDVGLVRRRIVEGRPPRTMYSITDKGRKALSLIEEMEEL